MKLDISKRDKSISVWIVERGKPEISRTPTLLSIKQLVPIAFSSSMVTIELSDYGANCHKTMFFFSFAH